MPRKKELFRIRFYTSSGHDFEFRVTWFRLILFVLFFSIPFGGFILNFTRITDTIYLKYENSRLLKENRKLSSQVSYYENQLSHVKKRMNEIFKMNNQLRLAMGLPEISEDIKYMGVGGYIKSDEKKILELKSVRRLVELEYKEVSRLKNLLNEKKEELRFTPSILPAYGVLTSGFGYRRDPFTGRIKLHEGLDISAPTGTPVYAPADGVVTFVGMKQGYGLTIEVDHGGKYRTRYAHLSKSLVRVGQKVQRGDMIAKVGNTGRSTGPHLHYEVRVNGAPVNPKRFIILSDVVFD